MTLKATIFSTSFLSPHLNFSVNNKSATRIGEIRGAMTSFQPIVRLRTNKELPGNLFEEFESFDELMRLGPNDIGYGFS